VDTDPGLVPNTTYYYTVRARKDGPVYSNYSNIAVGNTYAFSVYINFSNNFQAGSPWNNLAAPPQIGYVWNNFRDELGAVTSIGMVETGKWAGIVQPGVNTGNNSGVYPDNVLVENYGLFAGQVATMKVTGLNLSMKYNITFFASIQAGGDVNTGYSVNGKTVMLNVSYNKNGTVTMYDVEPDVNGELLITTAPGTPTSQFGLLGAMVIQGFIPGGAVLPAPPARTGVSPEVVSREIISPVTDAISLLVHPNPFIDYFNLSVTTATPQQLQVIMYDMNGKTVYQNAFGQLNSGTNIVKMQPQRTLAPGVYIVKAILGNGKETRTLKVIRN
jgi:hypothetical protein